MSDKFQKDNIILFPVPESSRLRDEMQNRLNDLELQVMEIQDDMAVLESVLLDDNMLQRYRREIAEKQQQMAVMEEERLDLRSKFLRMFGKKIKEPADYRPMKPEARVEVIAAMRSVKDYARKIFDERNKLVLKLYPDMGERQYYERERRKMVLEKRETSGLPKLNDPTELSRSILEELGIEMEKV